MSQGRLVFIASNSKGDALYRELAKHFAAGHYVKAGYDILPPGIRLLPEVLGWAGSPLKNWPELEFKLRKEICLRVTRAVRQIAAEGPRIEHIIHWHNLFPITSEWLSFGPCSAVTDVTMDSDYFKHFGINDSKARRLRYESRALSLRNVTRMFTHSRWAAEANRKMFTEHAHKVIPIGWGSDMPEISESEALSPRPKLQVVCVGHNFTRKGIDLYDQVAARLKARIPELECVVVGRPGRFDVKRLSNLKVLGPMDRPRLSMLLRDSSLFMLLSRFEPAGHVTVEAMSYGLPVICSTAGGVAESVVDGITGFACSIENLDDVFEKACLLLSDPERLALFRKNAYEHAMSQWQWRHVASRVLTCLKPLAEPAHRSPAEGLALG